MAIEDVGKRFCVMLRTDGRYSKTLKSVAGSALSAIKEPLQNLKRLIIATFRTVIKIGDYFYRNRESFLRYFTFFKCFHQSPNDKRDATSKQ